MTLMDAIRAEVDDWSQKQEIAPSNEVMGQWFSDSLDGGTPEDLAGLSVEAVIRMLHRPMTKDQVIDFMGVWCSAVVLGVRAAKRAQESTP